MKKSKIHTDTIARIIQADMSLGESLKVLKRTHNVNQEIADLQWARIMIEKVVSGLRKLKAGVDDEGNEPK